MKYPPIHVPHAPSLESPKVVLEVSYGDGRVHTLTIDPERGDQVLGSGSGPMINVSTDMSGIDVAFRASSGTITWHTPDKEDQ